MSALPKNGKSKGRGRGMGRGSVSSSESGSSAPSRPSPGLARTPPGVSQQEPPKAPPSVWGRGAQRVAAVSTQPPPGAAASYSVAPAGPSSTPPGQDVFVGRGGMRGGRRINEAESRMTKPLDATKQQELPQASPTVWGRGIQRVAAVSTQPSPAAEASYSVVPAGPSSATSGGDVFVGRGGMRGGRRINEDECRITKLPGATKKGTFGSSIQLQTNYFQLFADTNWCLYQYRVDFAPEETRTGVRKGLLRIHHEKIGGYIFDGTVMYTSSRLPEGMELFSSRQSDNAKIKISIQMVGELMKGDYHYIQFFNIVMRKCLAHLDLQLVGRNFYDAQNKIEIRNIARNQYSNDLLPDLQLWPGYVTSIRQCEYNILMCAEISHKVMHETTVLKILSKLQGDMYYQSKFKTAILGQVILTTYSNKTYRIDDVDFNVSPESTFKLRDGKEISYNNYYSTTYGVNIRNKTQPLLVSRTKPKDRRAGAAEIIYLVPELCRITGLTDEMRNSFSMMSALATYTKLEPKTRIDRLLDFNKRLLATQKVKKELSDWGLNLSDKLVNVSGRVIPKDKIVVKDCVIDLKDRSNWDMQIKKSKMLLSASLDDWVVVLPQNQMAGGHCLVDSLKQVALPMNFTIQNPRFVPVEGGNGDTTRYLNALENIMSKSNPKLIMCIVPNNRLDRYSAIKKKCCVDRPILSQVVLAKTIMSKGRPNLTAATKIAIQVNTKLGGAPWTVEFPQGNYMVAGFDVCHDKSSREKSYGALVSSLNNNFTRYFSAVSNHTVNEELSNDISVNMFKAVRKFEEVRKTLPSTIIFYRDGVGEGQVPFVHEIEVEEIKKKLTPLYEEKKMPLNLIFVIVTKRINTRFFYNRSNAPAGTVVDDVVTNPARFDFFLVSQSGGTGTITPSGYNVICNTSSWNADKIQRLTYKMTQMYFNYTGPIKVPAPCQYAHKLAALVGQAIHVPPSNSLEDLLYYL